MTKQQGCLPPDQPPSTTYQMYVVHVLCGHLSLGAALHIVSRPSVCLSAVLRPMHPIFSKQESRRNF